MTDSSIRIPPLTGVKVDPTRRSSSVISVPNVSKLSAVMFSDEYLMMNLETGSEESSPGEVNVTFSDIWFSNLAVRSLVLTGGVTSNPVISTVI